MNLRVEVCIFLLDMSWYKCFYKIGLPESERLLLEVGGDGSFLVRPSSSTQGQNTLSYRSGNEVSHIRIGWNGDSYGSCKIYNCNANEFPL